jgi:protein O-mannosyl-transferase
MNDSIRRQVLAGFSLYALLLFTFILYQPGLYGAFLLDDDPNLEPLAHIQDDPNKMLNYALDGIASRLGRPVSLITFALQSYAWPAHPEVFKYVNLMLHLLCGALIAWFLVVLFRLSTHTHLQRHALLLATAAAGVWLLHPFQVSTVLYVVQRMTQMATLFTLLSLVAYVCGRANLAAQRPWRGWTQLTLGLGLGLPLAVLSKENGILLLLYILVIEFTLLRHLTPVRGWKLWSWVFIYFPTLIIIAYFVYAFPEIRGGYGGRDFTMGERLLTQARVLLDYISKIFYPLPSAFGLFHDDYVPSRGWLTPPQTLFSIVSIFILAGLALLKVRHWSIFSFAVLWFLGGHVLESSFIDLVLYFEHRNYLALLGPVVGAIYLIVVMYEKGKTKPVVRFSALIFGGLWLAALPGITAGEAHLWGKPVHQAYIWAHQKPLSRYAQSHAASVFSSRGEYAHAVEYYRHMTQVFPATPAPYLLWLGVACDDADLMPDMAQVENSIRHAREGDTAVVAGISFIVTEHFAGRCVLLDKARIEWLYSLLLDSPGVRIFHAELRFRFAMFHAMHKEYERALEISASLALNQIDHQRERLIWMIMARHYTEARAHISTIRSHLSVRSAFLHEPFLRNSERLLNELQGITTHETPAQ